MTKTAQNYAKTSAKLQPYTVPNCRVVCAAVNSAMNQYGEEVLLKIAKMMLQKRRLEEKQKNAERADLQSDPSNDLPL